MAETRPTTYEIAMEDLDQPPRYPMDGMKICTRQNKHPCSCDNYTAYHDYYSHWIKTQEQQTQDTKQNDPINTIDALIMTTTLALIATVIIIVWAVP